jgi:hypothetical protein
MADDSGSNDRGPGLDSTLTAADIETNWDQVGSAAICGWHCAFLVVGIATWCWSGALQVCENYDDMGLREDLLRGIFAYGFEKPSAIQQRGTLPLIKGRDTIAQVSRHIMPQ